MPGLVRMEVLTDSDYGVGTRWREVRRMFGREAAEEFEVTGLELNRKLELYVDGSKGASGSGDFNFVYTLVPSGEGTDVDLDGEISGLGSIKELLGKLFAGQFKKAVEKDMLALKDFVERGSPPA
jgi:hypothetical protein